MATKILGVNGSLRGGSYSLLGLNLALDAAKSEGAETRVLDLGATLLPLYNPDTDDDSPALTEANAAVIWADAFILASPDYHGSMSGAMKNFLDYYWTEFTGKLFGYICASHEKGLTTIDQMRTAVRQCYGWSLPYNISIHGEEDFANGQLKNAALQRRIAMFGRDMSVYGAVLRQQFAADIAGTTPHTFAARMRKK